MLQFKFPKGFTILAVMLGVLYGTEKLYYRVTGPKSPVVAQEALKVKTAPATADKTVQKPEAPAPGFRTVTERPRTEVPKPKFRYRFASPLAKPVPEPLPKEENFQPVVERPAGQ